MSSRPATLGQLRESGWQSVPVKEEVRRNAATRIAEGKPLVEGVLGYEDTVLPQLENAVLAGHDHIYERVHANGLVYFVCGLGGDSRDKMHFPPVPGSVRRYAEEFGALRIDAADNYLLFRFFTWRGTQIDSYRMMPRPKPEGLPAAPGPGPTSS